MLGAQNEGRCIGSALFIYSTGTSLKSTGLPTATFCGFGPSCPVSRLRLNT